MIIQPRFQKIINNNSTKTAADVNFKAQSKIDPVGIAFVIEQNKKRQEQYPYYTDPVTAKKESNIILAIGMTISAICLFLASRIGK